MEAKASKHASKCEHACARARVCVCVCERVRRARARSLMATLPGGGPAEDGSELRSHASRGRRPQHLSSAVSSDAWPLARVPLYVPYADFFQYHAGAGRLPGRPRVSVRGRRACRT